MHDGNIHRSGNGTGLRQHRFKGFSNTSYRSIKGSLPDGLSVRITMRADMIFLYAKRMTMMML
jgi:hypothetical protein